MYTKITVGEITYYLTNETFQHTFKSDAFAFASNPSYVRASHADYVVAAGEVLKSRLFGTDMIDRLLAASITLTVTVQ
jgi:hypothetical protein